MTKKSLQKTWGAGLLNYVDKSMSRSTVRNQKQKADSGSGTESDDVTQGTGRTYLVNAARPANEGQLGEDPYDTYQQPLPDAQSQWQPQNYPEHFPIVPQPHVPPGNMQPTNMQNLYPDQQHQAFQAGNLFVHPEGQGQFADAGDGGQQAFTNIELPLSDAYAQSSGSTGSRSFTGADQGYTIPNAHEGSRVQASSSQRTAKQKDDRSHRKETSRTVPKGTHGRHHDRQRTAPLSSHASSSETLRESAANRGPRRMPSDRSIGSSPSNSYQYTQTNQAGSYSERDTRSRQQHYRQNDGAAYRESKHDTASRPMPRAPSPPRAWSFVSSIRDPTLVSVWDGRTPRGKGTAKPRPQDSYRTEDFSKTNIGMIELRRVEESLARLSRKLLNTEKPSNVDYNTAVDVARRLLADWLPQAILMPDLPNRRNHLDDDACATLEVDLRAASSLSKRLSGMLKSIFEYEIRPRSRCPAEVLTPFICASECFRLLLKYCHSLLIRQDWDQQDLRDTAEEASKLVVQVRACGPDFEDFERTYKTCTTACNFVSKSYAGRTPFHARLRQLNWEPAPQA